MITILSYEIIPIILGSYLLGSIPTGLLLTKIFEGKDIRRLGSGNIGATNVLRTGNRKLAAATLILDLAKGFLAVLIAKSFGESAMRVAFAAALLGHIFPVWLKFKGGKGVATYAGGLTAISWPLGLMGIGIWILTIKVTRISSLSAILAATFIPFLSFFIVEEPLFVELCLLSFLIILRHFDNIKRLINKTESKVGE